jgi:hypothetical protein
MPETRELDRLLLTGTESVSPMPPGTQRVENLIEGIGVAIFVAIAVGTIVVLIRNHWG